MKFQRVHKSTSQNPQTFQENSKLASRPFGIQSKETSRKPPTQGEIENQALQHQKMEATKLEIQAKYGTITPEGQERLGVLQGKMNDFWVQRKESSKGQPNLLEIPGIFTRRETRLAQQIQPQLTIGQPGDKYEQEADKVAADVIKEIHQNQSTVQRQKGDEQEQINTHTTELVHHNQINMNAAALSLQGNIVQCQYLNPGEYNSWLNETQAKAKVGRKGYRFSKTASRDALKAIDERLFYFVHYPSKNGDRQEDLKERISLLKGIKQVIKSSRYFTEDKKTEIFLLRQQAVNALLNEVQSMLTQLKSELNQDKNEVEYKESEEYRTDIEVEADLDNESFDGKYSQYSDKLEESQENKKTTQPEEQKNDDYIEPQVEEQNDGYSQPQLEEQNDDYIEPQVEEQNDDYIEPQVEEQNDGYSQPQLEEQNDGYSQPQLEEQNDGYSQPQLEEQNDGYSQPQLEEQNDGYSQPQLEEQNDG
ncbi:hypothetical protein H6G95_34680, partial [Nostoc linckia FACHB-391]